jgi:hypothetical protein
VAGEVADDTGHRAQQSLAGSAAPLSEFSELCLAAPAIDGGFTFTDFARAVAAAQLAAWLPDAPAVLLDLSGARCAAAGQAAELGHQVIQLLADGERPAVGTTGVVGDPNDLQWCRPESIDVVLSEGGALSASLATEWTVGQIARVLRPGGKALLCVDSLLAGCAALAEAGRWAELSDVPAADVVLVPATDGGISRCFGPEEIRALLLDAGFAVDWVRPRTVLPRAQVEAALREDPARLPALVRTEVALAAQRQDESVGSQLLVAARLPAG